MRAKRSGYGIVLGLLAAGLLSATACTRASLNNEEAFFKSERENAGLVSDETRGTVSSVLSGKLAVSGRARIGLLYYMDAPAHRQVVLKWLKDHGAVIRFESAKFGYLDAELDWAAVGSLIETSGNLGMDVASLMKLELDSLRVAPAGTPAPSAADAARGPRRGESAEPAPADVNSSFFGPAHSAGYGAQIEEFRKAAARDLGLSVSDLEGQGTLVAVYDGGVDLSRTDVFQNRIRDFLVGEESNWIPIQQLPADFVKAEKVSGIADIRGLEDVAGEPSLRFATLSEKGMAGSDTDLNGSGVVGDEVTLAVYERNGALEARFRPVAGLPFGDPVTDFGDAWRAKKPQIVDLYSGKHYVRDPNKPSPSAVGVRFRKDPAGTGIQVALVGMLNGSEHGIANLHMVGGNYTDPSGKVSYRGVAPQTEFLAMQTWHFSDGDYGQKWIPLARSILLAAENGADVIDLDIYTPGTGNANDMLSSLLCRVTAITDSVPVIASHNFGPLPDSVQSLSQSRCVLGIGASHSVAALKHLLNAGAIDPTLTAKGDEAVSQTAIYSGRGFGPSGFYKPDIISPAYGYTAYGKRFTRFAGTSGATPTTAGAIALLKQAARTKGVELNFEQVKLLLQGSSRHPGDEFLRDGYGQMDLAAAWEMLKKHVSVDASGAARFELTPVVLKGQQNLNFEGRPNRKVVSIELTRAPVGRSVHAPVAMRFWVEYGGQTPASMRNWVRFYNPATSELKSTLVKDMPMHGEYTNLGLRLDVTDELWAALPAGDHLAVVKGVREGVTDPRVVDFLQPISFSKGMEFGETHFATKPLYSDQYEIYNIATQPGQMLFFQGRSECLGERVASVVTGGADSALNLHVDNEAGYDHTSWMTNTLEWRPRALPLTSGRIVARRQVTKIAVRRYGQLGCNGPVRGELTVRKAGFTAAAPDVRMTEAAGKLMIDVRTAVSLTGSPLVSELVRNTNWRFKVKPASLVLSRLATSDLEWTAPASVDFMRVYPRDASTFQGGLFAFDAAGKPVGASATMFGYGDNVTYAPGMGSRFGMFGGKYYGVTLEGTAAGSLVRYVTATKNDKAVSSAVIELKLDVYDAGSSQLSTPQPITAWNIGTQRTLAWRNVIDLAKPAGLAGSFPGSDWSYELEVPFAIEEFSPMGDENLTYPVTEIWSGKARFPVRLND